MVVNTETDNIQIVDIEQINEPDVDISNIENVEEK
jgi:hypothetical protein